MLLPLMIAIGFFAAASLFETAAAQDQATYDLPLFRSIEYSPKPPPTEGLGTVRLLTDEDFPPFSFKDSAGTMTGLSVELALGVCSELAIPCEIVAKPWKSLRPALDSGQGSVIISGMRVSAQNADGLETTRPFFRSLGRFAARKGSGLTEVLPGAVAGKRIGTVRGSGHAAWLARYFPKSEVIAFGTSSEMREALRSGEVELVFGDAIDLIFWISGRVSQDCCELVRGAYVDSTFFSHPMFYAVRRGDAPLRRALDYGLDRMQESGRFAEIFRRYVPLNPW
jgi:polar amino acid transport system substrate-binding protein